MTTTIVDDPVAARARRAVTAVFFLNGLALASYIVRVPSLKIDDGLDNAQLGLVSTLFGASALVAMQFVGALAARYGSGRLIRLGLLAMPLTIVGLGLGRGFLGLGLAAVLLGAVHGTLDVSMNAHAVNVEGRLGRPIMSGCHAAWSVSAVLASLVGAGLVHLGVGPLPHFIGVAAVVIVAGVVVGRALLPASADRSAAPAASPAPVSVPSPSLDGGGRRAAAAAVDTLVAGGAEVAGDRAVGRRRWRDGWSRAAVRLGLTGMVLMVAEGAVLTWSGVYLHDDRGASLTLASLAVTAFTACQTGGRLIGDRLTVRIGAPLLFRAGAAVGTAGFALAVLAGSPAAVVAGFAIVGLGSSSLIPLTYSAAGHAGGSGPAAARFVARFTTFTYAGILLGPALLGWIAQALTLRWTIALMVPLVAVVALVTRLPDRR